MAKNSVFDWDTTAANNTDVGGVGITGNSLPSNLDDGMRTLMAQIAALRNGYGMTASFTWSTTQVFAGADANGETVMEFRTERPWFIRQRGSGSLATISLENATEKVLELSSDTTYVGAVIQLKPVTSDAWIRIGGRDVYHRGNILAAVGKSSGVPNGGIIETGSNANGQYVRYANGTQVCTRSVTITSAGAETEQTFTFPASFTSVEAVTLGGGSGSSRPTGGTGFASRFRAYFQTAVAFSSTAWITQLSPASTGVAGAIADYAATLTASGRWD